MQGSAGSARHKQRPEKRFWVVTPSGLWKATSHCRTGSKALGKDVGEAVVVVVRL